MEMDRLVEKAQRKKETEKGAGGGARWEEGGGCKILQPRGTHRDVISTTDPETYYNPALLQPPSRSRFPVHEWPILLGLSLGKSLSIPITAPPPPLPLSAAPTFPPSSVSGILLARDTSISPSFTPFFHPSSLGRRLRRTKISFLRPGAGDQGGGLRNRWGRERFLRCRFLSLFLLITPRRADCAVLPREF